MNSSTVTALLVVPHGDAAPGETAVSIGAVLDNAIVAWSRCQFGPQPPAAHELLSLVETRLLPALQAAPLTTFRAAAARLAALDVPAPLRRAVEESLLAAVASRDGVTRAELICREYALPPAGEVPPLYAALADDRQAAALCRLPRVAALRLTLPAAHPAVVLGADGSRLQRRVRDLCAQLEAAGAPQALHLNLQGGFGRLFGDETGKALGALYGLERAAGARPLLVEDALPPAPQNAAAWRELRRYLGFRQMRTRLLAGAGVCRAADVAALAAAEAVDGVHLRLAGMAGLDAGIQAVRTAREHGLMVLLSGSNPDVLAHVALAAGVDGVGVAGERPFAAQIEMQRAAAWLRHTSA